jgi:hypothetical protein
MSRTALPAHEQGEDDPSRGATAGEAARRGDLAGPDTADLGPALDAATPQTRRADSSGGKLQHSVHGRWSAGQLKLPAGPSILAALTNGQREHANKDTGALRSLLTAAGFGAPARVSSLAAVWQLAAGFAAGCAVTMLAAVAVASRHLGPTPLTGHAVLKLAVILACEVVLVTVALALAINETGRALTLGVGSIAALITITYSVFGVRAGTAVTILCVALVAMLARQILHHVAESTVQVTVLPGGRRRTLPPGTHLLLPGEHVLVVLSTRPNSYQTMPERVYAPNGLVGEAALWVQYAVVPERAAQTIAATRVWERALRRRITAILREELERFLADTMTASGDNLAQALTAAPDGDEDAKAAAAAQELRVRIADRLRVEAPGRAVTVLAVELRQVLLSASVWDAWRSVPLSRHITVESVAVASASSSSPAAQPVAPPQPAIHLAPALAPPLPPAAAALMSLNHEPRPSAQAYFGSMQQRFGGLAAGFRRWLGAHQPFGEAETAPTATPEPPDVPPVASEGAGATPHGGERQLSARTLAAMYEAVEEQRITDPETIRHVADALGHYAPGSDEEIAGPFDPQAAAAELRQLLAQQAPAADASTAVPGADHPSSDVAAESSTPQPFPPADEDNILRGG